MQLAIQFHQAGRLRKAESIYQQVLQVQPNHADALHLLGLANHQLGKHELASTLIKKAISLKPLAAQFHNNLGEVCRALNRLDEAQDCYEKALALQSQFPEAHRNLGLVYLAKGSPDQAISYLRDARERFPDHLGIHFALGVAHQQQHQFDEAIASYDRGLEINLYDPALLCAKGIALKGKGRLEEAIQHYQKSIALQPNVAELHSNLALIYQQQGSLPEAIACLQRVTALQPDNESAHHMLAALQNTTPDRAPAAYVREAFDGYADGFDQHLVSKLEYEIPGIMADLLRKTRVTESQAFNILDLGCGTGLFGVQVTDFKEQLHGIDLSPRMIDKARERGIYDQLIVGDLLEFLAATESGQFDLIAAADVFNYVGNLLSVFEHAARILESGGWFVFSIEAAQEKAGDFILDKTGRYQHSKSYIERLREQFGFIETSFTETCLRKEEGRPVAGYLYLLKKLAH